MLIKRFFYACASLLCLALVYSLGASKATARPPGSLADVAIQTGVLNDGEIIPLPVFSDGTTALESECHWAVSANTTDHLNLPELQVCYTDGRTVRASSCTLENGGCVSPRPSKANYMIIAVRRG